MSEKSTVKETLSINATICMRTDEDALVTAFLDDLNELMGEWQTKVQLTSLNVAIHDHRRFEDFTLPKAKLGRNEED